MDRETEEIFYLDVNAPYVPLRYVEKQHIKETLELVDWNKAKASRILNINRTTLYNKIDKYNLEESQ